MGLDTNVITYLACICFLFLFGRIFIVPVKKILKLVLNSIIGGLVIFTSIVIGFLGLPGAVILIIIKLLVG